MDKVSTATMESYSWGQGCKAWQLLNQQRLSVIEEVMPPGAAETLHYHSKAWQFFYILSGEAVFELGKKKIMLGPGEGVKVKPKLAHRISNLSENDLRILVISSPHSHADRIQIE